MATPPSQPECRDAVDLVGIRTGADEVESGWASPTPDSAHLARPWAATVARWCLSTTTAARRLLETGLARSPIRDPRLGCWGGQLLPRFEIEPPAWFPPYQSISPFSRWIAISSLIRSTATSTICLRGRYVRGASCRGLSSPPQPHASLRLMLGVKGKRTAAGRRRRSCSPPTTAKCAPLETPSHPSYSPRAADAQLHGQLLEGDRAGGVIVAYLRGHRPPPKQDCND